MSEPAAHERIDELEIKLAYQDRLIRELDALIRGFAIRLEKAERDLVRLDGALVPPTGAANEPPPHY